MDLWYYRQKQFVVLFLEGPPVPSYSLKPKVHGAHHHIHVAQLLLFYRTPLEELQLPFNETYEVFKR